MINIWFVIIILFIHWIADFICQSDWQAQNKSKNNKALLSHTATYSIIWIVPMLYLFSKYDVNGHIPDKLTPLICAMIFASITFVIHTITDYLTSRVNKDLWERKEVHWFFVSVGFDQLMHFMQLLVTYYVLKQN